MLSYLLTYLLTYFRTYLLTFAFRRRSGGCLPFCASTCAAAARSAMAGEEVHFSTNAGDFSVELYPSYAPRTCKNFSELCARALRPAACRLCPAATLLTE